MGQLNEKVYGADLLTQSLISSGKVRLQDDEKTVVFVGDNDSIIPVDDGIKTILETRKDIVKNTQNPGSGSAGKGQEPVDPTKMSKEERLARVRRMNSSVPMGMS